MTNKESRPNIQIDDVVRPMTDEELELHQQQIAELEQQEIEKNSRAAARKSALAKLAALGLTEEEIAAL